MTVPTDGMKAAMNVSEEEHGSKRAPSPEQDAKSIVPRQQRGGENGGEQQRFPEWKGDCEQKRERDQKQTAAEQGLRTDARRRQHSLSQMGQSRSEDSMLDNQFASFAGTGELILRITLGLEFLLHGWRKLKGVGGFTTFLRQLGGHGPMFFAWMFAFDCIKQ